MRLLLLLGRRRSLLDGLLAGYLRRGLYGDRSALKLYVVGLFDGVLVDALNVLHVAGVGRLQTAHAYVGAVARVLDGELGLCVPLSASSISNSSTTCARTGVTATTITIASIAASIINFLNIFSFLSSFGRLLIVLGHYVGGPCYCLPGESGARGYEGPLTML